MVKIIRRSYVTYIDFVTKHIHKGTSGDYCACNHKERGDVDIEILVGHGEKEKRMMEWL